MNVIASDNDPDLIWDAMPFTLKAMEIILVQDPSNVNIQLALASGYIQYAHGHLAQKAEMIEDVDYYNSQHLWKRTHNLSLRGRDYALAILDFKYPNFKNNIKIDTKTTLNQTSVEDVPALYWAATGWTGAIVADKTDVESLAELPVATAIMEKVLKLNPNYNDGAVHEFFIAYEAGRPNSSEKSIKKAESHFKEAIICTNGKKASPYIIYAESVAVNKQDLLLFKRLLNDALAINPNEVKKWRLSNTIAHERALWLQQQIPILFLNYKETE
jgi:predicted anti-sigma-YlaC factor YlaD